MAKKPTWARYQNSAYYQASNVAALQQAAAGYTTDPETLRTQAVTAYQPTYDATKQSLQQEKETALNSYNNQLSGLSQTYDQQERSANAQYDASRTSALNALTKRGLGRSSIVGVTSSAIENARNQALNDIQEKESDAYADIYNNITLTETQAAAKLQQLADSYNQQIEARMNELKTANQTAATNIQAQIAALQQSGYNAYVASVKKGSGGGSSHRSSGSSSGKTDNKPTNTEDKPTNTEDKLKGGGGMASDDPYNFSHYF